MAASSKNLISGSFYSGAYGPTITLMIRTREAATWLENTMRDQGNRSEPLELLGDLVHVEGVSSLKLVCDPEGGEVKIRKAGDPDSVFLVMLASKAGWERAALLIRPFSEGKVGHQYLGNENDDAIAELSYGEYPEVK